MDLHQRVVEAFVDSMETKQHSIEMLGPGITIASQFLVNCLLNEGKILVCGNGGNAAHAQHFASLLLNRFDTERPGLPCIAISADSSSMSAIANDSDFSQIFSKQINAIGNQNDILLVLSTSGESANITQAVHAAHDRGMQVVALNGKQGGELGSILHAEDIELRVPSMSSARVQETHLLILHCICDLIDAQVFGF